MNTKMSAPIKHQIVLTFPNNGSGVFAQYDNKYGLPLRIYAGGETLAQILCEERGGVQLIRRLIDNEWKEEISIQKRITDIRVIHTWYGENSILYEE